METIARFLIPLLLPLLRCKSKLYAIRHAKLTNVWHKNTCKKVTRLICIVVCLFIFLYYVLWLSLVTLCGWVNSNFWHINSVIHISHHIHKKVMEQRWNICLRDVVSNIHVLMSFSVCTLIQTHSQKRFNFLFVFSLNILSHFIALFRLLQEPSCSSSTLASANKSKDQQKSEMEIRK